MKYGTMMYLVSDKGNVCMIEKVSRKNDPNSGYITLPGGKLKEDEKGLNNSEGRLKSVLRETEEEVGIKPVNPVLRGIIFFDNKDRTFDNWKNPDNFLVYIFYAENYRGKVRKSDEGKPRTVSLDKVGEVPSNPGDEKMYEWLKDGRNFFGVIKHKGNEIDEKGTWVDFY
jgi:ADP-ribose pyrophosphatase YjhB (NUDIX family)